MVGHVLKESSENKRKMAEYSALAFILPVSIAVGLGIGYFLDRAFHTAPYLLIIFTLYGIAAGFINLIKMTKPAKKK